MILFLKIAGFIDVVLFAIVILYSLIVKINPWGGTGELFDRAITVVGIYTVILAVIAIFYFLFLV